MSRISELLIAASLLGLFILFIYWFSKRRNLPRLMFQVAFLFAFVLVLHAIIGFPEALFRPEDSTVSKGSEPTSLGWSIYLIAYVAMVAGMFSQYLYARFAKEAALRPPFDWGSFIAPIFVSPIIFLPLCSTLGVGEDAEAGRYMIFLVAFENGFFFKSYFDQRSLVDHALTTPNIPAQ
jgi:hypothetical protein